MIILIAIVQVILFRLIFWHRFYDRKGVLKISVSSVILVIFCTLIPVIGIILGGVTYWMQCDAESVGYTEYKIPDKLSWVNKKL